MSLRALEKDLGVLSDLKAAAAEGDKANADLEGSKNLGEDVRTVWVLYDEQGERHREWRAVVQEAVAHSFSDWPYQGPQSTIHTAKHMAKHGGDPKSWMQIWMRRHNLAESDRVVHELKTVVDVIYLGGTYDQLNLGSLASFEAVSRRLQTIVEAFSNSSGSTPDWSHARLYTGQATADDVVSPDLRSWRGSSDKDPRGAAAPRVETGDGGDEGQAPRGRGRGRGAKGFEAPAKA